MSGLISDAFGGVARWAFGGFASALVLKGWWTPEQGTTFETDATTRTLQYAACLGALLWSVYQKYRARLRKLAEQQLLPGASESDIRARMFELGLSDLMKAPTRELRSRMAMLEARVHDLEAKR